MITTERVPGMKPGATGRNTIVGALYLVIFLAVLPYLLFGLPIAFGVVVARNYRDVA